MEPLVINTGAIRKDTAHGLIYHRRNAHRIVDFFRALMPRARKTHVRILLRNSRSRGIVGPEIRASLADFSASGLIISGVARRPAAPRLFPLVPGTLMER